MSVAELAIVGQHGLNGDALILGRSLVEVDAATGHTLCIEIDIAVVGIESIGHRKGLVVGKPTIVGEAPPDLKALDERKFISSRKSPIENRVLHTVISALLGLTDGREVQSVGAEAAWLDRIGDIGPLSWFRVNDRRENVIPGGRLTDLLEAAGQIDRDTQIPCNLRIDVRTDIVAFEI